MSEQGMSFQEHLREIQARQRKLPHYAVRPTISQRLRARHEARHLRTIAWLHVTLVILFILTAVSFVFTEPPTYYFLIALAIWGGGHAVTAWNKFNAAKKCERYDI